MEGGTALTADLAWKIGKPYWIVALETGIDPAAFQTGLMENAIRVLNVAGPRESKRPGVYDTAHGCLESLFRSP